MIEQRHAVFWAALTLAELDTCFAHLHTGRSETRSTIEGRFYRTALGVSMAFELNATAAAYVDRRTTAGL
jgi:hypothetical protein